MRGGPEPLVSGEVDGCPYVLDASTGKPLEFAANDGPELDRADLRRLVALSARVASVYGGPQDTEWAIATDKRPWLTQSAAVSRRAGSSTAGDGCGLDQPAPGLAAELLREARSLGPSRPALRLTNCFARHPQTWGRRSGHH